MLHPPGVLNVIPPSLVRLPYVHIIHPDLCHFELIALSVDNPHTDDALFADGTWPEACRSSGPTGVGCRLAAASLGVLRPATRAGTRRFGDCTYPGMSFIINTMWASQKCATHPTVLCTWDDMQCLWPEACFG